MWHHDDRLLSPWQNRVVESLAAECPRQRKPDGVGPTARSPAERPPTPRIAAKQAAPVADVSAPPATPRSALAEAQAALQTMLAHDAVPTLKIRKRIERAGMSWMTTRRAAASLGVEAVREGFGAAGGWKWRLRH
jgi:hypothetical protein